MNDLQARLNLAAMYLNDAASMISPDGPAHEALAFAMRWLGRAEGHLGFDGEPQETAPHRFCDFCEDPRVKTFTDGGTYCLNCGSIRKPEDASPSFPQP